MIEINLLPKEMQIQGPRVALNRKTMVPALSALALVIAMAGVSIYQRQQINELDSKIRIAKARSEQLQKDIQMVDALVEIKEKITDRINAVKVLDENRTAWVNVMEDMSSRLPEFLWLTSIKQIIATPDKRNATQLPGDTAKTQVAAASPQTQFPAEIEGYAYSLSGLANLILNLRKSGHFKDVDLKTAREVALESHTAYSFALSCTLDYAGTSAEPADLDKGGPDELAQSQAESTGGQNQESQNGARP